jgi:hypothetical protein
VDGNIVQFTQVYDSGQMTTWRAVVKDDGLGGISMENGTWSGHLDGSFDAVRSPDRSGAKSQVAKLQGAEQRSTKGEGAAIAKLQLTISSLEHQLQLAEAQHAEDVHELQARHDVVEQQHLLEVRSSRATVLLRVLPFSSQP